MEVKMLSVWKIGRHTLSTMATRKLILRYPGSGRYVLAFLCSCHISTIKLLSFTMYFALSSHISGFHDMSYNLYVLDNIFPWKNTYLQSAHCCSFPCIFLGSIFGSLFSTMAEQSLSAYPYQEYCCFAN
jgi:hypothetical protein